MVNVWRWDTEAAGFLGGVTFREADACRIRGGCRRGGRRGPRGVRSEHPLFADDKHSHQTVRAGGRHLVVPASSEAAFKRALRDLGYILARDKLA